MVGTKKIMKKRDSHVTELHTVNQLATSFQVSLTTIQRMLGHTEEKKA
jgi:hypothetical protein